MKYLLEKYLEEYLNKCETYTFTSGSTHCAINDYTVFIKQ